MEEPQRRIRAVYAASTITVYQAYSPDIGPTRRPRGPFRHVEAGPDDMDQSLIAAR
jgi:hypothetical protein